MGTPWEAVLEDPSLPVGEQRLQNGWGGQESRWHPDSRILRLQCIRAQQSMHLWTTARGSVADQACARTQLQ